MFVFFSRSLKVTVTARHNAGDARIIVARSESAKHAPFNVSRSATPDFKFGDASRPGWKTIAHGDDVLKFRVFYPQDTAPDDPRIYVKIDAGPEWVLDTEESDDRKPEGRGLVRRNRLGVR